MKSYQLIFGILALVFVVSCKKDNKENDTPADPVALRDSVIVSNRSYPWEILWGPDNFIWMTERGGKISRVNPATGAVTLVFTVPDVKAQGEGGLLGMVLHPDFSATPQVFVTYNYTSGSSYLEKVVRYSYNGTTLTAPAIIVDSIKGSNNHNGSRLLISSDLKLFISTGDAETQSLPQNTGTINGKILRVNLDGSIPGDNPLPGNRVWSWGHRNPQGLVYANNRLYSSEHGPDSDDEINIIEKGRNYGWPVIMGMCNTSTEQAFCNANNVREPIQTWTPTIAPSGIDYYDNNLIPQWKHSLLVATLKNTRLMQLRLNGDRNGVDSVAEFFNGKYGRLRDVCISPEGKVYICTSNGSNDKIIEVSGKK